MEKKGKMQKSENIEKGGEMSGYKNDTAIAVTNCSFCIRICPTKASVNY